MIKTDRRLLLSFDWLLFLALLLLSGAGVVAIWSTTDGTSLNSYFGRQLVYLCCGLLVFLVLLLFDYHFFSDFIAIIYLAGLAVLGLVLIIGQSIHSNKSWIDVGVFSFQPSELMKILVIIALAKYYSELDRDYLGFRELLLGGLIVFGHGSYSFAGVWRAVLPCRNKAKTSYCAADRRHSCGAACMVFAQGTSAKSF
jgi:cell division protein FtsW (lipid II flippase)